MQPIPRATATAPGTEPGPEILFADAWITAVSKPSGMVVHRGWAKDKATLAAWMIDRLGHRIHAAHRLDRGTSGVMVFAHDPQTARALGDAFATGRVSKVYWALVRGHYRGPATLDHPIPRVRGGDRVSAQTSFKLLGSSTVERCSLVEARPHTGRLHQVRRHLKHLSHPIVGDVRYGKGPINRQFRQRWGLHRLALHARALHILHPRTHDPLCLQAPVPVELARVLAALGVPGQPQPNRVAPPA